MRTLADGCAKAGVEIYDLADLGRSGPNCEARLGDQSCVEWHPSTRDEVLVLVRHLERGRGATVARREMLRYSVLQCAHLAE